MLKASVAILFVCLASCGTGARDEVSRVTSPDGNVDAVIVETNGGATTSFGYEVHVVPRHVPARAGHELAFLYGASRNANAYGVNLRWVSATDLSVEYEAAKSVRLRTPSWQINGTQGSVVLRPGMTDLTAPAGGMLYNRQRAAARGAG